MIINDVILTSLVINLLRALNSLEAAFKLSRSILDGPYFNLGALYNYGTWQRKVLVIIEVLREFIRFELIECILYVFTVC